MYVDVLHFRVHVSTLYMSSALTYTPTYATGSQASQLLDNKIYWLASRGCIVQRDIGKSRSEPTYFGSGSSIDETHEWEKHQERPSSLMHRICYTTIRDSKEV